MEERKNPECCVKNGMACESDSPQTGVIHARDEDLARRKLDQLAEGAFAMRRNQTPRHKHDLRMAALGSPGDGVVVADGALPCGGDVQTFESLAIESRRTAPCEVAVVIAKNSDRGCIPGRAHQGWEM